MIVRMIVGHQVVRARLRADRAFADSDVRIAENVEQVAAQSLVPFGIRPLNRRAAAANRFCAADRVCDDVRRVVFRRLEARRVRVLGRGLLRRRATAPPAASRAPQSA